MKPKEINVKEMKLKVAEGIISIRYTVNFNGITTEIDTLSISPNFDFQDYKNKHFGMEIRDGRYTLFYKSVAKENGQDIRVHNYLNDNISNEIAEMLGKKIEEETPRFSP